MLIKALVLQKNRTLLVILCYEFRGNLSTLQGYCFYYEEICAASHIPTWQLQDWKNPLRADRLMILSDCHYVGPVCQKLQALN